jgi:Tfp pilus assembly pilus retraction ATPase PilT
VPAVEIIVANAAVETSSVRKRLISSPSVIQPVPRGMQTRDQSLYNLVMNNHIERTVAEEVAENPKMFASGAGF